MRYAPQAHVLTNQIQSQHGSRYGIACCVEKNTCIRVPFFNKGAGYRPVTLKETPAYQQTCGFCKNLRNTFFTENNPGDCSVLTTLLNSVFPIIVAARRFYLTGDMTNRQPFIQVRQNDRLENIPLMHRYGINTNILHITFSRAEF